MCPARGLDLSVPHAGLPGAVIAAIDARTATSHFPGIGRYVRSLLLHLTAVPSEFSFSVLAGGSAVEEGPLPEGVTRLRCRQSVFSLAQQWAVRADLRRVEAGLYHSPYYLMPYRPGMPAVVTFYDLIPLLYPAYFTLFQRTVYRWGHRMALGSASQAVAISESTKKDLRGLFGQHRTPITVVPLAAGPPFARASTDRIEAVRRTYGLPERYVLFLGTNKPHKNLPRLVEAWSVLVNEGRDRGFRLVIAGPWDRRYPQSKSIARESGITDAVVFAGPIDEGALPALYSGATLCVVPSQYEGFGLPVLEAMACGTPVLCSNVSSLPEVAGGAAAYFDPGDRADMVEKLARVLADKPMREELASQGRRRAALFSWEKTALATLEVYRRAIGGRDEPGNR